MIYLLLADPPWLFKDRLPGASRGASRQYPCMPVDQIARFPIPPMGPDAVLAMWRVATMQEEALFIARAWGFKPYGELVWNKLTKTGKPWFGMGRLTRNAHESILIATRGRVPPASRSERDSFEAKVPVDAETGEYIHSAKPDESYALLRRLYPRARRYELFARKVRPGWQQFGNQLGKVK